MNDHLGSSDLIAESLSKRQRGARTPHIMGFLASLSPLKYKGGPTWVARGVAFVLSSTRNVGQSHGGSIAGFARSLQKAATPGSERHRYMGAAPTLARCCVNARPEGEAPRLLRAPDAGPSCLFRAGARMRFGPRARELSQWSRTLTSCNSIQYGNALGSFGRTVNRVSSIAGICARGMGKLPKGNN